MGPAPVMNCLPGFGAVTEPYWNEVYLIGGGPSLRGFDLQCLRGRTVVAVNDAVLYAPWATALFSLDACWIQNRIQEIEAFSGEVYLAVSDDVIINKAPRNAKLLLRRRSLTGLSDDPRQIHMGGGNSGFGAFNLAYLKRARRIILLGYDFCHSGQHWHRGYQWSAGSRDAMYRHWAEQFPATQKQLRKRAVEVLNASMDSRVTCFPKIPLGFVPLLEENKNG